MNLVVLEWKVSMIVMDDYFEREFRNIENLRDHKFNTC